MQGLLHARQALPKEHQPGMCSYKQAYPALTEAAKAILKHSSLKGGGRSRGSFKDFRSPEKEAAPSH